VSVPRGRLIICPNCQAISAQWNGGHAEYMAAAAEAAMLLPDAISYVDAAPIMGAGNTVWDGLKIAAPRPAQTVAVLGIGGLGHLAVQYARVAGFRTITVSRSPAKDDFIREKWSRPSTKRRAGNWPLFTKRRPSGVRRLAQPSTFS
jgi:D-arabinose 1-dehydrogenase-like Zn-dependent alcohol dehydrogenase